MSTAVLRRSRRVARRRPTPCRAAGSPSRSRSSALVIGDVLAGRDVLAKSPTGSGKTLAFGIPLVERIARRRTRARRRSCSRRPASSRRQIVDEIRDDRACPRAARHRRLRRRRPGQAGQGRRRARTSSSRRRAGSRICSRAARSRSTAIRMLVLDEADRMLDMGFRPAVDRIVAACPADRQTLFFSATLDGEAGRIASRYTRDAGRSTSTARPRAARTPRSSTGSCRSSTSTASRRWSRELERERDLALVFVRTKHGADRLVKRLAAHGVEAVAMHGNKSQRQREQALARFESGARRHARRDRRRRPRNRRRAASRT